MLTTAGHSFKLTWMVEDYFMWVGDGDNEANWPRTPTLPIEALGNTEWQFKLCPMYEEYFVSCSVERSLQTELKHDVDIHYTFHALGEDDPSSEVSGTISNMKPGHKRLVDIIKRSDIEFGNWEDTLLIIEGEIHQLETRDHGDFFLGKWQDELETFSDDMSNLFETRYLSDLKLLSDDGRRIAAHSFVLIARWKKLCESLDANGFTPCIAIHGVSGSVLRAFVSYLYTGTLPGSDLTAELFHFAVENVPSLRQHFHCPASDITMRVRQRMERLNFTWYADNLTDNSMPFYRILPLHRIDCGELIVTIDEVEDESGDLYLDVSFTLSNIPEDICIAFFCTAEVYVGSDCVSIQDLWNNLETDHVVTLQKLIPMRLLTTSGPPTYPRVQFEIVITDTPLKSVVENWVTEFRTGSRGIQKLELLTSEMRNFFMQDSIKVCDVLLRTENGCFFSTRALLGVRSRTFLRTFRNRRKGRITVVLSEMDSVALCSVLEYVYTGWTKLSTTQEVLKVLAIAKRLSLLGLAEKCRVFLEMYTLWFLSD